MHLRKTIAGVCAKIVNPKKALPYLISFRRGSQFAKPPQTKVDFIRIMGYFSYTLLAPLLPLGASLSADSVCMLKGGKGWTGPVRTRQRRKKVMF